MIYVVYFLMSFLAVFILFNIIIPMIMHKKKKEAAPVWVYKISDKTICTRDRFTADFLTNVVKIRKEIDIENIKKQSGE